MSSATVSVGYLETNLKSTVRQPFHDLDAFGQLRPRRPSYRILREKFAKLHKTNQWAPQRRGYRALSVPLCVRKDLIIIKLVPPHEFCEPSNITPEPLKCLSPSSAVAPAVTPSRRSSGPPTSHGSSPSLGTTRDSVRTAPGSSSAKKSTQQETGIPMDFGKKPFI